MRHRLALLLALSVVTLIGAGSSAAPAAAATEQITVHPRLLPYHMGSSNPLSSGSYTVLTLSASESYVLYDDRTGSHTRLHSPAGPACELWDDAFAAPWMLFSCAASPTLRLYDVATHVTKPLLCGTVCDNVGDADPVLMGSDWVEIEEDADCDPRTSPCETSYVYVALPSGRLGQYAPSASTLLDLDSPTLTQTLCAPWLEVAPLSLSIDRGVVVVQDGAGTGVAACGSRTLTTLLRSPSRLVSTAHMIMAGCALSDLHDTLAQRERYHGVFLPGLQPFTLSLSSGSRGCNASFDDGAVYVSEPDGRVSRAALPTGPPPRH